MYSTRRVAVKYVVFALFSMRPSRWAYPAIHPVGSICGGLGARIGGYDTRVQRAQYTAHTTVCHIEHVASELDTAKNKFAGHWLPIERKE